MFSLLGSLFNRVDNLLIRFYVVNCQAKVVAKKGGIAAKPAVKEESSSEEDDSSSDEVSSTLISDSYLLKFF